MIERFTAAFESRFNRAQEIQAKGGRPIGWLCIYVPEELFHAAGLFPVRVLGAQGRTQKADAHFSSNMCSFTRSCLQAAFDGEYDSLQGIITGNNCDHVRRLYDVWGSYLQTPFRSVLSVPNKVSEESLAFYRAELARLKRETEAHFQTGEISDEALWRSIGLWNRMRRLLKEIYLLRQSDAPPLTGTEALEVVKAGMVLPKEEYVGMLEELLPWLKGRGPVQPGAPRLLITGSEMDDTDYVRMIEQLGGAVVADDLCVGTRYFWEEVEEGQGDPLTALARRYLSHTPSPPKQPPARRFDHLTEMIRTFGDEGIV
ncbi:MAG: 2-hydroxyacyl-CoA dehydratase, partial [Candidatus Tectomicrobia bacterium]|nr:2-hydroxyacyl-CoA dehydratase [Candidatus Tectomicrobia bacterium]